MNESNLLADGLVVMGLGVGFVLTFLCLMIFTMSIMAKVVEYLNKVFPVAVPATATPKKAVATDNEESVALAILSAILRK